MQHDGDDWVLHRTQEYTDSSLIAKNTYSSLAALFYTHLNPLYNRFRMKHKQKEHDDGLWVKGIGREIKFRYRDETKSEMEIYGAEIGYDREIWYNAGSHLQVGLYGGLSDSRQKYDRGGRGDGDTQSLGLYSTWNTADNWFVDVVGTYFWHTQKIKSYTPSGSDVNGKYDTNAWQASAFAGKRWNIAGSWFVEPYVGLSYMRVDGIDYRTNFNTRVSASATDYFSGNVGLSGGREFVLDNGAVLDAYGRVNLLHDWDGKSPVTVADEVLRKIRRRCAMNSGQGSPPPGTKRIPLILKLLLSWVAASVFRGKSTSASSLISETGFPPCPGRYYRYFTSLKPSVISLRLTLRPAETKIPLPYTGGTLVRPLPPPETSRQTKPC